MRVRTTRGWQGEVVGTMVTQIDLAAGESLTVDVGSGRAVVLLVPEEPDNA